MRVHWGHWVYWGHWTTWLTCWTCDLYIRRYNFYYSTGIFFEIYYCNYVLNVNWVHQAIVFMSVSCFRAPLIRFRWRRYMVYNKCHIHTIQYNAVLADQSWVFTVDKIWHGLDIYTVAHRSCLTDISTQWHIGHVWQTCLHSGTQVMFDRYPVLEAVYMHWPSLQLWFSVHNSVLGMHTFT
jgi:hypothetical protein